MRNFLTSKVLHSSAWVCHIVVGVIRCFLNWDWQPNHSVLQICNLGFLRVTIWVCFSYNFTIEMGIQTRQFTLLNGMNDVEQPRNKYEKYWNVPISFFFSSFRRLVLITVPYLLNSKTKEKKSI